ncbi:MAG: AtpZ/AtpI family protein [Patescibacteria group bacterium]|nr:AtpZ/AtpI family protein [Patescibacteria group bacterium]MDD4304068.1 AtpZ/AtpI family protein [Patescibacteria group bacterium]MDD4694945.1 AtpZ/AtpI family protein [Patescibacteria group bacterium]
MKNKLAKERLLKKPSSMKELALGMITYNASSILGPLIVFLIIGFILDKIFHTKPLFMISSVVVAFIVTNILMFGRIKKLIKEFNTIYPNPENKKDEEVIKNDENKL